MIEESDGSQQPHQEDEEDSKLKHIVDRNLERKEVLGVVFSGTIRSASFKMDTTLSVLYALTAGAGWEQTKGQPSGMSQKSTVMQEDIVWNLPFSAAYQTKSIVGWPQLVLIFYGTDYFGRSIPRAYGNMYLPRKQGRHSRKIKIFNLLQNPSIWNCWYLMTGSQLELKCPEQFLAAGDERLNLRVEYYGEASVEIQVKRTNFQKLGYQ